jgi:hypothetical protein
VSLAVLFLLVGVGALRDRLERGDARERAEEDVVSPDDDERVADDGTTGLRASGTATVALAVVVGAGIGAAALVRLAGRRAVASADRDEDEIGPEGPPRTDDAHGVALPEDLDEADIASEADPRRAVLLAYALLERRLASTRVARQASTSPQEWLDHVHRGGAPALLAPFRTLTALYERARFSVRPVTPADQATAVAALHAALDQPSTSTTGAG